MNQLVSHIETYHGTRVSDPYRWLESVTTETQTWLETQNLMTRAYLENIPVWKSLKERIRELSNYPSYSVPLKRGNYYYFMKNTGGQNQSALYMSKTLDDEGTIVLDPNLLSSEGTVALTNLSFSRDGLLLAYSTSTDGGSWQTIRIHDIVRETDYDEEIKWCRFTSIAWQPDNCGFYYSCYPEPGTVPSKDLMSLNKVYWHEVGTKQTQDRLIFEQLGSEWLSFSPLVTFDGRYLLLNVGAGTDPRNRIYYREIDSESDFVRLLDEADASYKFIGNSGSIFYFHTTLNAPCGRIIAIDTRYPEQANWKELISEQIDSIFVAFIANQQLVIVYMHDAHHHIRLYTLEGSAEGKINLPLPGSIIAIAGKPDEIEIFFCFTSFLQPPVIYRYDCLSKILSQQYHPEIPQFNRDEYETRGTSYLSKDGTRIPLFLTYKKGLVLDGKNPVLLFGYGGFNISITPFFTASTLVWMERGGVYAVANVRGGGEYGETWHQAGTLEKKQNVFDDFIAASEWLIAQRYTCSSRLAIHGESNGGLLVAACLVQRPDLYGAAICVNPVIDMLRYCKFTAGKYWIHEYGDAENDPEHFKFLYAYSPLHNIKVDTVYPPTLIVTSDTDDRVVPAHAMKFTAALQDAQVGNQPILLRLQTKTGHGTSKSVTKEIEEQNDMLTFLFNVFKMVP